MSDQTNPTITEPLTPVEAALIRAAEAEYKRAVAEATAARREAATLVLQAHQVPQDVTQWTITTTPQGLAIVYVPAVREPAPTEAGQVERTLGLVKDGAPQS